MKIKKIMILVITVCLLTGCLGTDYLKEGVSLLEKEQYKEALNSFQNEIKEEQNLDEAYRGMGIAYFEMGEFEKAVEAFEEALDNGAEQNGTICNLLGISHMNMEKYEDAIKVFEKGVSKEDCSKEMKQEMQFNTIVAYEKIGDWDKAKEKVEEYIEQYPDDAKVKREAEFLETR